MTAASSSVGMTMARGMVGYRGTESPVWQARMLRRIERTLLLSWLSLSLEAERDRLAGLERAEVSPDPRT